VIYIFLFSRINLFKLNSFMKNTAFDFIKNLKIFGCSLFIVLSLIFSKRHITEKKYAYIAKFQGIIVSSYHRCFFFSQFFNLQQKPAYIANCMFYALIIFFGSSNIFVECHRRWQITIENNYQNLSHPAGVQ